MRHPITAAMIALLLAGCGGEEVSEEPAEPLVATVTIELRFPLIPDALSSETAAATECGGALDYSQVQTGAAVTFRDASDAIVGTAELEAPFAGGNLVVCTWELETEVETDSDFVTAEVGGWTSQPEPTSSGRVEFVLDTVKEHPEFGSEAEVDPSWTRSP